MITYNEKDGHITSQMLNYNDWLVVNWFISPVSHLVLQLLSNVCTYRLSHCEELFADK